MYTSFVFLHISFLIFSLELLSNLLNHSLAVSTGFSQAHYHYLPYEQKVWSYYSQSGFKSVTMETQDSQAMLTP